MYDYSFSVPFNTISLLYLYVIAIRVIVFDYAPISYVFWDGYLLPKLLDKARNSNRKTIKKGSLYVFNNSDKQDPFWKGVYGVVYKLNACPFCKGVWAGYILYFLVIFHYSGIDLLQIADFALFSWSCGVVSLLASKYV